jgi:hypothetical protein
VNRNLEKKVQFINEVELEVDFLMYNKMFLVTEGEKRIRSYRILLSEDEGVSLSGQVEFIIKTNNSPEVHFREGICRRNYFVPTISEGCLEAE